MRSCVYAAALLALVGAVSAADPLTAQSVTRPAPAGVQFDADIASIKVDGYALASLRDVAASLWGSYGRFSGIGTGNLARFETGSTTAYGELHGSLALSSNARNLSAVRVDGGGGAYRGHNTSKYAEASLMLGHTTAGGLLAGWIDAGAGRMAADATRNTSHARVGGSVRSASASIGAELGAFTSGPIRYRDALVHAQVAPFGTGASGVARIIVGADGGVRASKDVNGRHGWLMAVATAQLLGPVSLIGYAGAQPPDPERGTLGAAFTSLGVRVALGASNVARPVPGIVTDTRSTTVTGEGTDGRRMIRIVVPAARTVEIMGDFTAWLPVAMTRSESGNWEVRIPLALGSHRVEIRADSGAWVPAPGLPVVADEFGGSVGILVVS